jgi:DNA-binding response OmpR family regulator
MNMSSLDAHVLPRVLHIDPDLDAAVVLATLLVPDTEVVHASTLEAARRQLDSGDFALVVLDPDLPDGDGHTLVRRLREHSHVPVLLYTASQPALHHQAHAFLPKPWTSPRQLWHTVAHLLDIDPQVPSALQP